MKKKMETYEIGRVMSFFLLFLSLAYSAFALDKAVDDTLFFSHAETFDSLIVRNPHVVKQFLKKLGRKNTPPGAQVDHVISLHCGGKDEVDNLQLIWGRYKDAKERAERNCKLLPQWLKDHPCHAPTAECVKPE